MPCKNHICTVNCLIYTLTNNSAGRLREKHVGLDPAAASTARRDSLSHLLPPPTIAQNSPSLELLLLRDSQKQHEESCWDSAVGRGKTVLIAHFCLQKSSTGSNCTVQLTPFSILIKMSFAPHPQQNGLPSETGLHGS